MLCCTEMHIVDAVEVHVLGMPWKRCLPHAEVQVCRVHTLDLDAIVLVDVIQYRAEFVDVPARLVLIVQAAGDVSAVNGRAEVDIFPVLPL